MREITHTTTAEAIKDRDLTGWTYAAMVEEGNHLLLTHLRTS